MADKSFGVKELNLLNASGTPTVTSPNNLNLNANTVAISTSATVGNNLTVTSTTNSANLNVTGIGTLTRGFATDLSVSGISTISQPSNANPHSLWDVVNNSSSAYRFTGPGQDGAEDNPNIYLVRGQRYVFKMNASGHPFQIRVANAGAAYSDGVTNNGAQSGNVVFNVQHDAPAQLYYQCTSHGGMVGNIYIVGGPQVISGVVTATSFSGSGANLTSLPTQVTIANNADNRVITGGSGTNLNGEANLTFNGNTLSVTGTTNLYGNGGASAVWGNTGYTGHLTYDGSDNAVIRAASGKALIFQTNHTNERLRITSSGTAVFGGNAAAPIVDNGELYYRGNSTSTFQNLPQNFYLYSDDKAYNATNPGAGMLFGGQYTSGGQYTTFAGIHGIKEDNTDNNYNSALVFGTRQQGSNTWERLRIGSSGQLGIAGANYGSSGQVLTSQGSGSAVQWATPMSALISSTTVSSDVSSVTFTEALTGAFSTYGIYVVTINGMRLANDDRDLRLRVRTGTNGATLVSSNDYLSMTNNGETFAANSFWRLNYNNIGNEVAGSYIRETFNAIFYFYGFEANKRCRYHGQSTYQNSSGTLVGQFVNGAITDATEVTGLEFFSSSGNINLGKFSLFGVNG